MNSDATQVRDAGPRYGADAGAQKVPPGYRRTDAGVIPEDWDASTVGAEFTVQLGKMLDAAKNVGEPKPYIGNRAVQWGRIDLDELATVRMTPSDIQRFRLNRGDLLVCEGGEIGRAAIWECPIPECYYQKALHRLRPTRRYDVYLMLSFFKLWTAAGYLSNYVTQTSIAHLPKDKLETIALPLPPTIEQRAIAEALADVDGLLGALEALIAKKRAIKQAAMQQLLTGKTRLPGFSGGWETVRLADVSAFITKGSTPTTYGFEWQSSGVMFLRSECVSPRGLDLAQSMFISAKAHHVLRRSAVQSGDLLITITGNVGRVVRLPGDFDEANINQHLARIRVVDEATHPGWVYHWLSQPGVRRQFEKITSGQAYPQISLTQVRDAAIPRPSMNEQGEISAALSAMDAEIAALEARRDKTRDIKQGMMQQLLTGRVRLLKPGAAA
jgi:type I restriction enzyme S subunit